MEFLILADIFFQYFSSNWKFTVKAFQKLCLQTNKMFLLIE